MSGWQASLNLLEHLLERATAPRYRIIHGQNELEDAADEKCLQMLEYLQMWTRECSHSMGMLFTTSGLLRMLF